jgi:hypothetical protein
MLLRRATPGKRKTSNEQNLSHTGPFNTYLHFVLSAGTRFAAGIDSSTGPL